MNLVNSTENPPYFTFDILSKVPGLAHGIFTRHGGVSAPPYDTLNAAWSNGDSPDSVRENLTRINGALGFQRLVSSRQVHGDHINFITEHVLSVAESRPPLVIAPSADALATDLARVGLVIKIADCQSIFLVDPETRILANIHCGWRGSVQNIAGKAVDSLKRRYGCNLDTMLAAVGPSLGPCCAQFRNYRDELPPELWSFQVRPEYFDFWAITRHQLTSAGILPENIEIARRCTVCEKADFFSYRGERAQGRIAAVIGWRAD
jgi:polyphenol oxidase